MKLFKVKYLGVLMIKRICFFSRGFAFNRLNRLKYYEKIFPKNVELFLYTTNAYKGMEKEKYQHEWDGLKRTKIIIEKYSKFSLPLKLRRFCKEKKVDRLVNLGNWSSCLLLLFSTIFSGTTYMMNILAEIFPKDHSFKERLIKKLIFYPLVLFSEKTIFNDLYDYRKNERIFGEKTKYLPATINIDLFNQIDKIKARKKLKLPLDKKIVIFVGRVDYGKGSDILTRIVDRNKEILFVVIGRMMDKNFEKLHKTKPKNLIYIEKKSSSELVLYYCAADLGYFPQRIYGGGLGMTTAECMACGTPAINRNWPGIPESKALYQPDLDVEKTEKVMKEFFDMKEKSREKLKSIARDYVIKNNSDRTWAKNYVKVYLN